MEPMKKVKTSCMNERYKVCSDGQGNTVLWVHGYMYHGTRQAAVSALIHADMSTLEGNEPY